MAALAGRLPSFPTIRARIPLEKSLAFVGDLNSRMPRTASVAMMLQTHTAMMPTTSSDPNLRMSGTLANHMAANAKTASKVTTRRAGPSPLAAP